MKMLVTGCCGFIGSNLAEELSKKYDVVGIDNLTTGKKKNILGIKMSFYKADISDYRKMIKIFNEEKPDYVFHLAALPRIQFSLKLPIISFESNVLGTQNILECSRLFGVKKVIFSSSSSVYGDQKIPYKEEMTPNPISLYALHKYFGEKLCQKYTEFYKLPTVCLRYFNVYGKNMNMDGEYRLVIPIWKKQKENGEPLTIYGDGEQTRDFTHISDVVTANIKSIKRGSGVINIGTGVETSMNKLARYISNDVKYKKNPRPYEEKRKRADITKAMRILKWKPKIIINGGL